MKVSVFIWLDNIVDKLWQKHEVDINEVEEQFINEPHFRFIEKGHRESENVYAALGQTDSGRYLITFFVHKQDNQVLILSSRTMTDAERKLYEKH